MSVPDDDLGWIGVQVDLCDLLALFPRSHLEAQVISGIVSGVALIVDDESGKSATLGKAPRGRRRKGGGAVEQAVQDEFAERLASGQLPEKAEGVWQEVMDWAKKALGEEISRSTAQRYLAPILHAHKEAQKSNLEG